jgi:transcription antitermination factor NusG
VKGFGIGYGSSRAKFFPRQRSRLELGDAVEGDLVFADSGSLEFWDSNGGSFSRGLKMGNCNQQWPWFAVLVRTSKEKTANWMLENAGYECFLPTSKYMRRWSDRMKEVEVPLFPGYLFCRMNPHNRLPVLMTPGVMQIVGVGKKPIPVAEEEIAALQRAGKSGLSTMPWPYLEVGHVARIEDGPLRGMTGIVIKIKSGLKLVLSVNLLQRSVAVEIDRSWIGAPYPVRPTANQTASRSVSPQPPLQQPNV